MYQFLTGPMLWLSFGVFIVGCAVRVIMYVRGLSWQLDRVAYGYHTSYAIGGALRSIIHWLIPFYSRNWRLKPAFTVVFFLFHLGLVFVPLFLYAHVMLWHERFGISLPSLPAGLADFLTIGVMLTFVVLTVRRLALPEVRIITTPQDFMILVISVLPFLTGFISAHSADEKPFWLLAHIVTGEIWLLAIPFTKLAHVVLFFMSRIQIGMDFGIKRGGMKGRGIVW